MATFSLDDIRAAAEKKYGSTDIDLGDEGTVVLVNPLRLPKDKRKQLMNIQEQMEAEGEEAKDQETVLADALRLVAKPGCPIEKLIEYIGDDLAQLAEVFSMYTGGTEAGEA